MAENIVSKGLIYNKIGINKQEKLWQLHLNRTI